MLSIYKSRQCSFDRPGKCDRESKHYVNCPLDYDTKMRLQRAALENRLKRSQRAEFPQKRRECAAILRRCLLLNASKRCIVPAERRNRKKGKVRDRCNEFNERAGFG
ncbi:hypothetical protein GOC60_31870 [Sinorhizobium meliloti]|nr:hypothetical protein [Sinorhizobium meliloti]MDX0353083.1 hypothetical protein [Sinorhizobium meliloti]